MTTKRLNDRWRGWWVLMHWDWPDATRSVGPFATSAEAQHYADTDPDGYMAADGHWYIAGPMPRFDRAAHDQDS